MDSRARGTNPIPSCSHQEETGTGSRAAMHRADVGDITFNWGSLGNSERAYEGGSGFSHIVAKHGGAVARQVPEVLAYGQLTN